MVFRCVVYGIEHLLKRHHNTMEEHPDQDGYRLSKSYQTMANTG